MVRSRQKTKVLLIQENHTCSKEEHTTAARTKQYKEEEEVTGIKDGVGGKETKGTKREIG